MEYVKYTHRHPTDGNVAVGTVPNQFAMSLSYIAVNYISALPNPNATTHHTYYTDLAGPMRLEFDYIQYSDFWKGLRQGAFQQTDSYAAVMFPMEQMNEIYYSNPDPRLFHNTPTPCETYNDIYSHVMQSFLPKFDGTGLYGAAANLVPHRDCILYNFPGIRVYRAIVSATTGNTDTITRFITHDVEKRLNKGDYMVFDFDRTLHQVKKTGKTHCPRVLLKIHFLVCDAEYAEMPFLEYYVRFAAWFYNTYYIVARYTEQIGTDPHTFAGFFFGMLWEYPFYTNVRYATAVVYLGVVASIQTTHGVDSRLANIPQIIAYSALDMLAIYLCIVVWVYSNYLFIQHR